MVICHTNNNCSTRARTLEERLLLDKIKLFVYLFYTTFSKYLEQIKDTT